MPATRLATIGPGGEGDRVVRVRRPGGAFEAGGERLGEREAAARQQREEDPGREDGGVNTFRVPLALAPALTGARPARRPPRRRICITKMPASSDPGGRIGDRSADGRDPLGAARGDLVPPADDDLSARDLREDAFHRPGRLPRGGTPSPPHCRSGWDAGRRPERPPPRNARPGERPLREPGRERRFRLGAVLDHLGQVAAARLALRKPRRARRSPARRSPGAARGCPRRRARRAPAPAFTRLSSRDRANCSRSSAERASSPMGRSNASRTAAARTVPAVGGGGLARRAEGLAQLAFESGPAAVSQS